MNKLKYYTNRVKWRLLMPLLRAKSFDSSNSIFIFSEPRGGSTWLMELISKIPYSAPIFEPFHSHYGALESYTWGDHYHKDQDWKEGKEGIDKIINADKFDSYQLERASWLKLLFAKQLIFKCVMGTSILPWIVAHFQFNYKPVFILRHPLAVASSTLENLYKRDSKINVDHRWNPSGYNLDLLEKHKDLFTEDTPMIDQLIARWCINNHYILNQKSEKWISVYYEQLLLAPKETITALFSTWSIEVPDCVWDSINQPSHSDFRKDFRQNKNEQINKWLNKYSTAELKHFQSILDRFDINIYSMENPMPRTSSPTDKAESRLDHE